MLIEGLQPIEVERWRKEEVCVKVCGERQETLESKRIN